MKIRPTYGYLRGEDGSRVEIKQAQVAAVLSEYQERLERLSASCDRLERTSHDAERMARALKERTESLAALQNSWWTRLGEALGIVRIKASE